MSTKSAYLGDRAILRVCGVDAAGFLQGLLTNDVEGLPAGEARYCALLTPQGKILFDFLVLREAGAPDSFLVDCPADQAVALGKRLGFYRLRAKATIEDVSADLGVAAMWDGSPDRAAAGTVFADPRDARLGFRLIAPRAQARAAGEADLAAYEALRIALGVPEGGVDFPYGDIFPHDANMDLLHGVDFDKGCYVGQEVVSRMRHRAGLRKRIVRLRVQGAAPAPGTLVLDGDLVVGTLGSAAGGFALAQMRIDRIEEARAAGRVLTAGGAPVEAADHQARVAAAMDAPLPP
jgi:tRNA-modifying protein YgfZ